MKLLDRLFPNRRAHDLIVLWETRVKPDLQAEIEAWPEDKKEERALLKAFLDKTESRIVAQSVLGSFAVHADKKDDKFVKRA